MRLGVLRRWPPDYWRTTGWRAFRAHMRFVRIEQLDRAVREAAEDHERERESAARRGMGVRGKPPPADVLRLLPTVDE